MWRTMKQERLLNGMPITPVTCDSCMSIWRFLNGLPRACPSCGAIHDLVLNEDGSIETTQPTEDEIDEINRLKRENEELKERLSSYALELMIYQLKEQGLDTNEIEQHIDKWRNENDKD